VSMPHSSTPSPPSPPLQLPPAKRSAVGAVPGHRFKPSPTHKPCKQTQAATARPGRDITHWPDSLLELLLCPLKPAKLARYSQVCHQWYRVANQIELQAKCFMRSYPASHRQRLEQALAPTDANSRWLTTELVKTDSPGIAGSDSSGELHVQIYHLQEGCHWKCVTTGACRNNVVCAFPLALRPDGQQLARPDASVSEDSLCMPGVDTGPSTQAGRPELRLLCLWQRERVKDVISFPFSPCGACFTVSTHVMVQVWRATATQRWTPQHSVTTLGSLSVTRNPFAFSPDGQHYAIDDQDEFSIHGTGHYGQCVKKVKSLRYLGVCRFLSTPDGSRLIMATCDDLRKTLAIISCTG